MKSGLVSYSKSTQAEQDGIHPQQAYHMATAFPPATQAEQHLMHPQEMRKRPIYLLQDDRCRL